MKKFTFVAMMLLAFISMAKAEVVDKYFYKIPTDVADGWTLQDAGRMTLTPGKDALEVKLTNNGGRMLNRFWNEDAWKKVDVNKLPNHTYKFTKDLKMVSNATRTDMEFVLLPVNACTPSDSRVQTHNYHWFNTQDAETPASDVIEDFFFRYRVTASTATEYTILINERPNARDQWVDPTKEGSETAVLSVGVKYTFAVVINAEANTATYTISDAEGTVVKTGVHNYVCAEDRAGIWVFSANSASSVTQLSNMGLSYEAEGPFASEPSVDLLAAIGAQRAYYVSFNEGETLHWKQLGDAEDATGNSLADGEEYTVAWGEANDTREFEIDTEETFGKKIIYCTKNGNLVVWTSLESDESNVSDDVIVPVTCEEITMPTPVVTITNVSEGFAKEYQVTADNSNTLLKPTVTIKCTINDNNGTVEKELLSGEKITLSSAGSITLYSYDGTHPNPWYKQSETVTVNNDVEYEKKLYTNYAWTKAECDAAKAGYSVLEIVDSSNKSHWDRIYSDQKYGYDDKGVASVYEEGKEYAYVKEGFNFYPGTSIGTENAKWNVQVPENIYTGFLPMIPAQNDNYAENAWAIFPLQGVVYYQTNITNLPMSIDPQYVSDDAQKPNFYIVHTRGGYDRPDKGDCNKTTVCVAGEDFSLYRYDTAICDVTVMTYKGFVSGVDAIQSVDNTADTVKKMVTKNGIMIVKGNKVYSVSGAQIK